MAGVGPSMAGGRQFSKTIQSNHPNKAFTLMDVMRRESRFTDIVLVAEGRKFPAHRAILCACSPYFDRMFQPGFIEQDNKEIVLKDFDPDTLAALLEFMYTAKITITEDNAQDILIGGPHAQVAQVDPGANLLLLYPVREAAGEVLGRLIDCSNVLLIRSLASAFSCREVETRAHNFLLERFEMVSKTEEFLKLDLAEVKKYLLMDDIIVRSEESIFECIIRWIETDPKSRESHFEDLIPAVRFPLVSEHYVLTVLQPHPMVQASKLCQGLIREAASLRTESCRSPGQRLPQYRGSNQLLFLQCANMSPWLKTPPVLYDFKKNSWTSLNGPTGPCRYREGSSYIFHDNSIYSFGGESNMEPEGAPGQLGVLPVVGAGGLQVGPAASEILIDGEVYRYCLEERQWSVHSCMLGKRKRHQAVVLAGRVYVLGGSNEYSVVQAGVEVMDLKTGVWTQGVPMLNRRVSHGAVALNNCLYVVGGWDGQGVVKSVEMFNPTKGVWQEVSTHPNIRMKSGVAALDGKIYVVGGCLQTLESCYRAEVFDPLTRAWKELPETNHARATPVLVPYRGKLYVFGGEGNSQGVVECYDPYLNEWTVLDTRIKHHVNGAYTGCLVDKPWDWDIQQNREAVNHNMQRILSGVGLDVVQTVRSLGVFGNFDS